MLCIRNVSDDDRKLLVVYRTLYTSKMSALEEFMWFAITIIMIIFLFLMVMRGVLTNDLAAATFYYLLLSFFLGILLGLSTYPFLELSRFL